MCVSNIRQQWLSNSRGDLLAGNRLASSPLMAGLPVLLATVGASTSTEAAVAEAAHGPRGCGFLVITRTLEGDPAPMLSELAHKAGTVLAIGAYGHSLIRRFIVGSTTTALLPSRASSSGRSPGNGVDVAAGVDLDRDVGRFGADNFKPAAAKKKALDKSRA